MLKMPIPVMAVILSAFAACTPESGSTRTGTFLDNAGFLAAEIGGPKSDSMHTRDASFCHNSLNGMDIFAFTANNDAWGIAISSIKGLPSRGKHLVSPDILEDFTAEVVDKTAAPLMSGWQRYEAQSGEVEITGASEQKVSGRYHFVATPTAPKSTGGEMRVNGKFEASKAQRC